MALVRTIVGDLVAPVTVSRDNLMETVEISFSMLTNDELVSGGAFNIFQPIAIYIFDGDPDGNAVVYACWVTKVTSGQIGSVTVTARDGSFWLDRQTAVRPTADSKTAGAHLLDLLAAADDWPIVAGEIDTSGPTLTLPDERKTYREWLDWLVDQTAWEWSVDQDVAVLGTVGLNWQQQIGTDVVVDGVTIGGVVTQVAALEEGQLIAPSPQIESDGLELFSRVRVTASGLSDVVQTNTALADIIGIHETVIDLGRNATADDQVNTATQKIAEIANPHWSTQLVIPRTARLWSALKCGNTIIVSLVAAPLKHWEGTGRIVGRTIDEAKGTMTLDILSVWDWGRSAQPVGSGLRVQGSPVMRKVTPKRRVALRSLRLYRVLQRLVR
jgi:hypothetical protein